MRLRCEWAWLGGPQAQPDVLLEVDGDRIVGVGPVGAGDHAGGADVERLPGLTIPGLVNAHSHAFHRALRSRTQAGTGSFWTWRDQMYRLAATLTPDSYQRLATATFAEMALAGITTVGEFHYLHHGPGGQPYDDPNAMGHALVAAAADGRCAADAARHVLPARRDRPAAERGAAALLRRRRGGVGRAGVGRGLVGHVVRPAARSTPSVPSRRRRWGSWARGRTSGAHRCTPTSASSRPRTRTAPPPTAGRPSRSWPAAGLVGERFTAVHATHLTATDVTALGGALRLLLPDDRAGPGRRDRALGRARRGRRGAVPRVRLPRGDRPVRGGAGGGARCPAGHRRPRPPHRRRPPGRGHGGRRAVARLGRRRSPSRRRAGRPHRRRPRQRPPGRRRTRPPRRGGRVRRRGARRRAT